MKRTFIAVTTAVVIGFISAVGLCFRALFTPRTVVAVSELKIVIDAGHGGVDAGVLGRNTGLKESDVNLAVSYRLKDALEDMGFAVTLTRKTDAGLYGAATKGFKKRDMQKRKEIIEETNPALVISVHQNFYPSKTTRGGQVFYRKADEESHRLAACVQENLNALYEAEGAKNRTEMAGEYFMLECWSCPSVIVECGFLSNSEDEALLGTEIWQTKLARSIAGGVLSYFGEGAVSMLS